MVECDSELSTTSIKPVYNRVITQALDNKVDKVSGKQLSTEDFTTSLKNKLVGLKEFDPTEINNEIDALAQQVNTKQNKLVSGTNIKTLNGESILGEGNIVVNVDTSNLATKDELIEVEEVAAAAFNDLKGIIDNIPSVEVDAELSADSENAIQNKIVTNELNTKVDKVEGKQLSTEDFTTLLKEKLEGLSAFDPTEINNAIEGLQNSFDALVSGNTSAAIESFNEFVAFLSGITDTQTLAGIVASLEQMIAAKQDKINDLDTIRSGAAKGATAIQQVKTINGEEIVGEGNIEINVDTSTLATKEEVTNLINEVIDDEEVLAHSLNELNERVLNIAEELTGDFASKEEFDSALESLSQADTTNQQAISEVSGKVTTLTERVDNIPAELADDFATKEALETSNSNLTNEVIDDEKVLAHAINDLNARLEALTARIATLESNNA